MNLNTCTDCGKPYLQTPRARTNYCPKCRAERMRIYLREYYRSHKGLNLAKPRATKKTAAIEISPGRPLPAPVELHHANTMNDGPNGFAAKVNRILAGGR